jgi:hypothetical protein
MLSLLSSFVFWLSQQAIALLALAGAIVALIWLWRLQRRIPAPLKQVAPLPSSEPPEPMVLPRLSYYSVPENTHAIRNQKLVNYLALYFRNTGGDLYYENVEFERRNKRLQVEILAEEEIEFFTDPRDEQKIETGESLKVAFEREIGEAMVYNLKVFFQDEAGKKYYQRFDGHKGEAPQSSDPILIE